MGKFWIKFLVSGIMYLAGLTAWAQTDSLLRQADRLLGYRAYGRAIEAYSQLLNGETGGDSLTQKQKLTAQTKLAYAYRQVGDGPKSERYYREAVNGGAANDPQQVLLFAQTLAGNGKLKEAQQQYERYLSLKEKQPAPDVGQRPLGAIPPGGKGEPVRYRLEYLAIDTKNEEFSPAFYREGLVYVAGRKGGSPTEAGTGGSSGYLDLYYIPNRNSIAATSIINADGTTAKVTDSRTKTGWRVGDDSFSRSTANDSPTVPNYYEGIRISQGLGYGDVNPSKQFSKSLNTRYHEGPTTFSHDGLQIIFTRNNYNNGRTNESRDGVTKLKLYTAIQQDGAWTNVVELPFNSNEYSVGHPSLNYSDELLYFASDMPGGYGGTDIYVSRFQNGQWTRPTNLGPTVNSKGNELFPFADETGNLYFSSDGRKGLGGLDIFYVKLNNGVTPLSVEHLDAPLNSPKDDFGLITDGSRMGGYFSSNRQDNNDNIYRFVRESSLYGCRNLTLRLYDTNTEEPLDSVSVVIKSRGEGRPDRTLNTDADGYIRVCLEPDNSFLFQASRDGYITSMAGFTTRGLTGDQPTRLEIGLIKPTVAVDTITATNALTGPLTQSRITGTVLGDRDRLPLDGVVVRLRNECDQSLQQYVTGADGRYNFNITDGCDYTLIASKPTFGTSTSKIKRLPKKTKPKEVSADLRMLKVGDVVTIDNIYYDLDQSSLRSDATREIDRIVAMMQKYPSLIIEIRSHTDSRGDAEHNRQLSQQRAKEVANYLVSKGVARRRMAAIGMGESQLVNNCTDGVICTEAEHQRNRRTEFKVVSIK